MKRYMPILGLLVLVLSLSISASAGYISEYVFQYENIEILVKGEMDYSEASYVAESLIHNANDEKSGNNRSIICTIFGHDLKTSMAIVREHNVSPTQPKCVEYQYRIINCTRSSCDYIEQELIRTTPLSSCH